MTRHFGSQGAPHVLLHPRLAGKALKRWKAEAMADLPPAATVVLVPEQGLR
ncbi:hypothetical protein [Pseudomonas sp.]|uniref:hypothetical protein n=1 Tax=Pseudomonas sp. TaxID=306 RepID=UPI0025D1E646|nr:hypothetical protein [Pseudomonas sp.]